jgi:DNA primase
MLAAGTKRETPEARAAFLHRLDDVAALIKDKTLAAEYKQHLRAQFYAERRQNTPGGQAFFPRPPFQRGQKSAQKPIALPPRTAPDPAGAELRRARLLLATLLAHPVLMHDVEEAFAHVPLPPDEERLRHAVHEFAASAICLDSDGLFTHLETLGLGGQARDVQALAGAEYRLAKEASPAEAAEAWWSWYGLMEFSIDMLRTQRDEAQAVWLADPDDQPAWERLKKYNELLAQARIGGAESES